MITYMYPADLFGCGHYRMIWVGEALKAAGHDVRIMPPGAREGIGGDIEVGGADGRGRLIRPVYPADADCIVMQRVSLRHLGDAIPMIRRAGVAIVVDMDDDLTKIDPNNGAFWAMQANVGDRRHNWRNAHQACLDATLVTVSTPALLDVYAPHGRGIVLENRVPASYLDVPHVDSPLFGWGGSTHSHPFDLHELGPAVARLIRDGHEYRGIGPSEGLVAALGVPANGDGWDVTGATSIDDWPRALATLGVGLAPLADTRFNEAKSWLKVLEMAALGVPWVASPRREYQRLRELGLNSGMFAKSANDWYSRIRRLITTPALRQEWSAAGRAFAADWTVEGNAWRWMEAWSDAVKRERSSVRSPFQRV